MLGLRTNKGITEPFSSHSRVILERLEQQKLLRKTEDEHYVATQEGLHILNRIIEELML
jgi:ribosomal protein S19E (S16A)